MKRHLLAITLSIAILGVGCGGLDKSGVNIEAQLQTCLGDGTTFLFGLVSSFSILQSAISDNTLDSFSNMTATPVAGLANTWDFRFNIDGNADLSNNTTLAGRIVYSADPTNGIASGETATLTFAFSGSEGYGGAGALDFTFQSSNNLLVSGSGDIDMPGACSYQYDVDQNSPMSFGLSVPILTAEFFGVPVAGVLRILARYGSSSLETIATFQSDSNVVSASQVMINGDARNDFDVEIPFDPAQVEELQSCLFFGSILQFEIVSDLFQMIEDFLGGSEFTDGTLTMTATANPLRFDFVVTYDAGSRSRDAGDVITGSVTYSEDPDIADELEATLRFNFVPVSGIGRIFSSPSNPPVAFADDWGDNGWLNTTDASISGRVIADLEELGQSLAADELRQRCLATTTFSNYREGGSGSIDIRVTIGGDSLWAVFRADSAEEDGFLYLNGVPLPFQLFFGFRER